MGKTLHSKANGQFISGRTIQSTAANSSLPVSKGGKAMSPRLKKFMDRVVKSNAMSNRARADSQHLNLTSRITGFDSDTVVEMETEELGDQTAVDTARAGKAQGGKALAGVTRTKSDENCAAAEAAANAQARAANASFASGTVEEMGTETEEFYNPFHDKGGKFTFKRGGKRGKIHVPMSDAARSSNAILRAHSAAKKSKEYKTAQKNARGTWANREKGQGGLRGIAKGANSKKADAARAANAQGGKATAGVKRTKSDMNAAVAKAAAKAQAVRANAGGKKRSDMTAAERAQQDRVTRANDKKFGTNVQGIVDGKKG